MPEDPIWAERRRHKKAAVPLDQQKTFQFDIEDFSIEEQREMALEFKFAKELEKRGLFKGYKKDRSMEIRGIIAAGWQAMYAKLFGADFVDVLAPHHIEAIEWHWMSRLSFLTGKHPEYLAYFPIWSRGHMKSSVAERLVVVDAIMSVAFKMPGYGLFVGRNKDKVQEHVANIEGLLASAPIREMCPALSTPKRTEITNQQRRWTSSFLKTNANYSIQGGTLDSGLAGSRVEETRPSLILFDDIDGREDSPVIAESRFRQLTTEVLPMGQANTLVFWAQNLISRFSTMYRIHKGQARVLTNRKPTEPIPAVRNLVTESRVVNGIIKDIFVAGEPTWKAWDVQRIQDEIDREGLPSFERECQHSVEESREGQIFYNYNDAVHVISESEFIAKYGSMSAWLPWRKKPANDWARTKTDKHANVAAWLTKSSVDSEFPNITFLMSPMSFPADSSPEDVAERLLSCLSKTAYGSTTWRDLRKELLRNANADTHTQNDAEKLDYERGALQRVIPKYTKPLLQRCNVQQGDMSHEMDTVRKIYGSVYGLGFRGVNPGKHGGVEAINRAMRVDYDEEHPFRPGELGYTTWFLVAPDCEDEPYREVQVGDKMLQVRRPRPFPEAFQTHDIIDSDLARFHFVNWRFAPPTLTAQGETIDTPLKLYDDFCNMLQFCYLGSELSGNSLTMEQKIDLMIPERTKEAVAAASTGMEKLSAMLDYEFQKDFAAMTLNPRKFEEEYD